VDTQAVYEGRPCPRFANIRPVLERKLAMLDAATTLQDLRSPPANRLENLARDDQYRLCFVWTDAGPIGVECVDYH
jgi:proteic killer suppression protein